jgi:hypothetical protein
MYASLKDLADYARSISGQIFLSKKIWPLIQKRIKAASPKELKKIKDLSEKDIRAILS